MRPEADRANLENRIKIKLQINRLRLAKVQPFTRVVWGAGSSRETNKRILYLIFLVATETGSATSTAVILLLEW
ncbi:unnamed protein product [Protopolystoma xenopodis]|uniref:Uncharacterized protein n=1 Tax=Protopolystoma xenopodis TaxID=117903 RepID=A0A3S5CDX4_9PLAT|nr:unnamed protein product [Protopolystoma xenopodis]